MKRYIYNHDHYSINFSNHNFFFFNRENMFVCARLLQSCLTICNPMDYSLPASSDQGTLQARILECYALLKGIFLT